LGALVLDASVALGWALPDEDRGGPALAVLAQVAAEGGLVPSHWRTEVGNALMMAVRRKRLAAGGMALALARLSTLRLQDDTAGVDAAWEEPLRLAIAEGLTLYDALYLELALRRGAALASFDQDLRRAARRHGLVVLP
jgi:predicted nucleic acid-binding protein